MTMDAALDGLQEAELGLANALRRAAEHHAAERDVYHVGHTLAHECEARLTGLAPFVTRYGAHEMDTSTEPPGQMDGLRRRTGEAVGGEPSSAALLLDDLRGLFLDAERVQLEWVILKQGASAVRDAELLAYIDECWERVEMVGKWIKTRVKETAPTVLARR